jgi:tetratricopeptide (TPR) repeat protein
MDYVKRRDALVPTAAQIREIQKRSPREYVDAQTRYLERVDALAAGYASEQVRYDPGHQWASLGIYARFQAGDPALAIAPLEKAAKARNLLGQLVLADTYQLALKDKAGALRAYQLALDTASRQPPESRITPYATAGSPMNEFWKAWLAAEIDYLRTGKRFSGRVPEVVVTGFWEAMGVWVRAAANTFPDWPVPYEQLGVTMARAGMVTGGPPAPSWSSIAYALGQIDPKTLRQRLQGMPPSRYALFVTLRQISALPDAETILRELGRPDPSGYWTTVILGTVAFHEGSPARRDEALANGVAEALPGMAAAGKPNALATAARRHLQARELRVMERKP